MSPPLDDNYTVVRKTLRGNRLVSASNESTSELKERQINIANLRVTTIAEQSPVVTLTREELDSDLIIWDYMGMTKAMDPRIHANLKQFAGLYGDLPDRAKVIKPTKICWEHTIPIKKAVLILALRGD